MGRDALWTVVHAREGTARHLPRHSTRHSPNNCHARTRLRLGPDLGHPSIPRRRRCSAPCSVCAAMTLSGLPQTDSTDRRRVYARVIGRGST